MPKKMIRCFNCGVELIGYVHYGSEPLCCGSFECERELRDMLRQQEAEARERAAEDGYSLYGGPGNW